MAGILAGERVQGKEGSLVGIPPWAPLPCMWRGGVAEQNEALEVLELLPGFWNLENCPEVEEVEEAQEKGREVPMPDVAVEEEEVVGLLPVGQEHQVSVRNKPVSRQGDQDVPVTIHIRIPPGRNRRVGLLLARCCVGQEKGI
jgi:hypothetical protein